MEVTPTDLQKHAQKVNAILQETCGVASPTPLVRVVDGPTVGLTTACPAALCREVTNDMGIREVALRLPVPDTRNPKFWIGIHEQWQWKSKHRVTFLQCGLRIFVGERNEGASQFLRLEWVAPTHNIDGTPAYAGVHAGHPHWHVDRSALVSQQEYFRSLELSTATLEQEEIEEFNAATARADATMQPIPDFSWIQQMHLPARAQWMESAWDGRQVPGPHQCEPANLDELARWWMGALRYLCIELPQ